MSWFEVDRSGLRELWGGKDKCFLLYELVANSLDEPGVTYCRVSIKPVEGKRQVTITVEDDAPEGFIDLSHAYTLFAPTRKRGDAETRGRFNIGEKHVLCLAEYATISSTQGTIVFGPKGRTWTGTKRHKGSLIAITVKLTKRELEGLREAAQLILPPRGVRLVIDGTEIAHRDPLAVISTTLATELIGDDGMMRPTKRMTTIHVHQVGPGEEAMVFEMGIPVMPTGDRWHIDVLQKIPLSIERDNVRPSWLRDVRAEVLNYMASDLERDHVSETWVRDGMSDDRISRDAVETIVRKRWGENRVVIAPGDTYSREKAIENNFTIVSSREMSSAEWKQIKRNGAIPTGKDLWPRDFTTMRERGRDTWTSGMIRVASLTMEVAKIAGLKVRVMMIDAPKASIRADYKEGVIRYNVGVLGEAWFEGSLEAQLSLIVHELGHAYGGHYDKTAYDGLAAIGAKLALADAARFEKE